MQPMPNKTQIPNKAPQGATGKTPPSHSKGLPKERKGGFRYWRSFAAGKVNGACPVVGKTLPFPHCFVDYIADGLWYIANQTDRKPFIPIIIRRKFVHISFIETNTISKKVQVDLI